MNLLKQSTAVTLKVGPFVDATDGYTAKTALTINQADVKLAKNGGAFTQKNDASGGTHDTNGWYAVTLNATDAGTVGILQISIQVAGARPVQNEYMVVPANTYDSLVGGTATLAANTTQWNGTNVAAPATAGYPAVTIKSGTGTGEVSLTSGKVAIATGGILAASFATDAVDANALAANAATEIATAVGARTVEGAYTEDQVLRLLASILLGKVSGMDSNAPVFRDIADSKNRVTAAVDAKGNRTTVTINSAT